MYGHNKLDKDIVKSYKGFIVSLCFTTRTNNRAICFPIQMDIQKFLYPTTARPKGWWHPTLNILWKNQGTRQSMCFKDKSYKRYGGTGSEDNHKTTNSQTHAIFEFMYIITMNNHHERNNTSNHVAITQRLLLSNFITKGTTKQHNTTGRSNGNKRYLTLN